MMSKYVCLTREAVDLVSPPLGTLSFRPWPSPAMILMAPSDITNSRAKERRPNQTILCVDFLKAVPGTPALDIDS